MNERLVIIGSGPSGLTAAIYAARAGLQPLMIEGSVAGGQLMLTTEVENYPGFPDGIMGPEMMQLFRQQAERFETRFITADVTRVDFSERPFGIWIGDDEYRADAVIISTGASMSSPSGSWLAPRESATATMTAPFSARKRAACLPTEPKPCTANRAPFRSSPA